MSIRVYITLLMLLLSGDVQLNPGPRHADIFPCGFSQKPVTWSTPGICCGNWEVWFHCPCVDIGSQEYMIDSMLLPMLLPTGPTNDPNLQHTSSSQVLHSSPKHSNSLAGHAVFGSSRSLPSSIRSSKATDATCSASITHNSSSACNSSAIPSKKQNLRTKYYPKLQQHPK